MLRPAYGQLPATSPGTPSPSPAKRSTGTLGRVARLGLIGLLVVPFYVTEQLGLAASTQSETVVASADAQIRSFFHDRNYGAGIRLRSRAKAGDQQRTLLRFTLPSLPSAVRSVSLRLYVRDRSNKGGEIHRVTGSWSETSVTWDKAPALDPQVVGRIGSTGRVGGWVSVNLNLTGLKSGKRVDLAIVGASSNGAWYASRETGKGPRLVLTLDQPVSTPTPTDAPTATPTDGPTDAPTDNPTDAPTSAPTDAPTSAPTDAPTSAPTGAPPAGSYLLVPRSRLMSLPTSGAAWSNIVSRAGGSSSPNLSDQDNQADVQTLAQALVYARTGDAAMRTKVINALHAVQGTEAGSRALALGRGLAAYVLAADLIGYRDAGFVSWVSRMRTVGTSGGPSSLTDCANTRPNNWGTWCRASLLAADLYVGASTAHDYALFKGWVGDRSAYNSFNYGDLSWQCDPSQPVGINPACSKSGHNIGGVLPDDQRRAGSFTWPPPCENYVAEVLQGVTLEAVLLERQGHAAWSLSSSAIKRAVVWRESNGCAFSSDDRGTAWVTNDAYGLSYGDKSTSDAGKGWLGQSWLFP